MLADGRTVPADEVIECDVCIVGAGPAGVTLARELSATGREIVLLERGEAERTGPPTPPDTVVNLGLRYALEDTRAFGFGGSSQEWLVDTPLGGGMGRLRELDADDFELRDWIPHSGWPFSKDELQPFYGRARALFDTSDAGTRSDDEWEAREAPSAFADPAGHLRTRMFAFGNPAGFAAQDRRHLENRENVLVLTNSVASKIQASGSSASAVQVVTEAASFSVVARIYVLAAGGLETPRILLCSRAGDRFTLGNEHDLVGRFFMEHPHYVSGLLTPTDPRLFDQLEHHTIHVQDAVAVQRKYSLSDDIMRREGLQRCVFMFSPSRLDARLRLLTYSDAGTRAIQNSIDIRDRLWKDGRSSAAVRTLASALAATPYLLRFLATKAVARAGQRLGWNRYLRPQVFKIQGMAEQIPNPDSRLVLTDRRDGFGLPVAGLLWRLAPQDLDGLRRTQEMLGQALANTGQRRVRSLLDGRELLPGLIGGCHHMGTTRMHDSPRKGVVDRDARLHDVHNVYVAGSSVFPTVGYANPILTTLALTLRLADHLRVRLQ